jgi:hypothetical protein
MAASVVKTLEQVFDQVQAFRTVGPQQSPGIENLALIAYRGEERIPDESYLNPNSIARQVRRQVMDNINRRFEFPDDTAAIILTDDYNPLDVFDIATREELRRRILEHSEWDILGYSG